MFAEAPLKPRGPAEHECFDRKRTSNRISDYVFAFPGNQQARPDEHRSEQGVPHGEGQRAPVTADQRRGTRPGGERRRARVGRISQTEAWDTSAAEGDGLHVTPSPAVAVVRVA